MHQSHTDYCFSNRHPAILLVGPTGSGKSPLGAYLQKVGFNGMRCRHLDFGGLLRDIAAGRCHPEGLTDDDVALVSDVLEKGVLLENDTFYIAENILCFFISRQSMSVHDLIVLNGLPRHVEQARDVDRIFDVRHMIYLQCTPAVVHQRILSNAGGDRTERSDDTPGEVTRKIGLFQKRTLPLVEYYETCGIPIHRIDVGLHTTPKHILEGFTA
jgi:adenylate kinase family enzyme